MARKTKPEAAEPIPSDAPGEAQEGEPAASGPGGEYLARAFLYTCADAALAEASFHSWLKAKGATGKRSFPFGSSRFQAGRNGRVVEVQDVL